MQIMSDVDKLALIEQLEERGVFFRAFWAIGDIYFDEQTTKTACVTLNGERISFIFNPDFWEEMSQTMRLFVICHEQMHLMLNHFKRLMFEDGDVQRKNIAADIAINHALVNTYGFDREVDIDDWKKFCWVETIFPSKNIPSNETAEYYYALLRTEDMGCMCSLLIDDHDATVDKIDGLPEAIREAVEEAKKEFDDKQKEDDSSEEASLDTEGMGSGQQEYDKKKTKDASWKKLYYSIPKKILTEKSNQHWINSSRRFALLSEELMLPTDVPTDVPDIVRVNVYLDTSGSCTGHAMYFLESALSIHDSLFKIDLYGFGTKVYSLPKVGPYKLKGFGNESYQAVSDHVDTCTGVDAVFVLTDGFSKKVTPRDPKKWHWLITPNGTTNYIDPRCNTHDLKKYNWKGK